MPVQFRSIKFNGKIICARAYEEDEYFSETGEKLENGITGMKEVPKQSCFITTNKDNKYGIIDKFRQYTCRK